MFGAFRFVLAALVALSHFGVTAKGFNPGQWAVISFYMLSGLLMERQFKKLSRSGNGISSFYVDRFLRIYPLFFILLALTWIGDRVSWGATLANFTLLPLNYYTVTGLPVLIAPTWSLACEVHFYLLVPLLTMWSTKALRIVLCASLGFFIVSPFLPDPAFWAYTFLPGVLFTFVSGILINREDRGFIKIIWSVMLLLLVAFAATKHFRTGLATGIHINVSLGYLFAVVACAYLVRFSPNVKWDRILGLFSYPLFLCHELAGSFVQQHWHLYNPLELLFASLIFSAVLIIVVETPFDRVRYRLRAPSKQAKRGVANRETGVGV